MSRSRNIRIFLSQTTTTNTFFSRRIRVVIRNPRCRFIFRPLPSSQHSYILRDGRKSNAASFLRPRTCPFDENYPPSMGQLGQRQYRLAERGNRLLQREYPHGSRIVERGWTSYHLDAPLEELVPSPLRAVLSRAGGGTGAYLIAGGTRLHSNCAFADKF